MKRLLIMLWLLAPLSWGAFDAPYWPATNQALYTNAMAQDIFSNVLWRACSAGRTSAAICVANESVQWVELHPTNLIFTNCLVVVGGVTSPLSITVTSRICMSTNVTLTNVVTAFEVTTPTGVATGRVTIRDTLLEQMDTNLETLLPLYSLPDYTAPTDWCFDDWFTSRVAGR